MNNKKLTLTLPNGKKIVAEIYGEENAPYPMELTVCLEDEEGGIMQDLCVIRPHCAKIDDKSTMTDEVEVLVWADKDDEDYTNKFIIEQYEEEN